MAGFDFSNICPLAQAFPNYAALGSPGSTSIASGQALAYPAFQTVASHPTSPDDFGSQHYNFHESLEQFWNLYRKGSSLQGESPPNEQYGAALEKALRQSGHSRNQAARLADQAASQRTARGLSPSSPVPKAPDRLPQAK